MLENYQLQLTAIEIEQEIKDVFEIENANVEENIINFYGKLKLKPDVAFEIIRNRVSKYDYIPFLQKEDDKIILRIATKVRKFKPSGYTINIVLLLATILTTLIAGATIRRDINLINLIDEPSKIYFGIPFSFTLLLILGVHELGHYFMAKRNRVRATLPYFIPAPNFLGTFGAVIKIKSPMPNKKALLDIGVSGPLAGFIIAIFVSLIGLKLSNIGEIHPKGSIILGESILFKFLSWITIGELQEGKDIMLHPIALAGWIGLLVTSLNLLPLGQLDGGHLCYSIFGRERHFIVGITFIIFLLFMSFFWEGWIIWVMLIFLIGLEHPPPLEDITELDKKRKTIGIIALIIFILTFTPIPIKMVK
jgi:membrane-associated protease RseP (regulator of RpoE activity)